MNGYQLTSSSGGGVSVYIDGKEFQDSELNLSSKVIDYYAYPSLSGSSVSQTGCAASYKENIYLMEGNTSELFQLDSDTGICTSLGNFGEAVSAYQSNLIVYKDELYLIGDGEGYGTQFIKYDGSIFTTMPDLPQSFYEGCALVYKDCIYLIGYTANYIGFYKWDGSQWTQSSLPFTAYRSPAAVFQDKIYVISSESEKVNSEYCAPFYCYDGSTWTQVGYAPSTLAREGSSLITYDNKLHCLGNYWGAQHYSYDGESWTQEVNLPINYYGARSAIIHNGAIHILFQSNHYEIFPKLYLKI